MEGVQKQRLVCLHMYQKVLTKNKSLVLWLNIDCLVCFQNVFCLYFPSVCFDWSVYIVSMDNVIERNTQLRQIYFQKGKVTQYLRRKYKFLVFEQKLR